jgi:hypothetical protein
MAICYNEAGTERPNKFASEPNPPDPRSPRTPKDVLLILKREARGPKGPEGAANANKTTRLQDSPTRLLEFRATKSSGRTHSDPGTGNVAAP